MEKVVVRFEKSENDMTIQAEGELGEILAGINMILDEFSKETQYTGTQLARMILGAQQDMDIRRNSPSVIEILEKLGNGGRTDEKSKK